MKKPTRIAVLSAVVTALCLAFAACGDDQTHSPSDPPVYYTVTYDLNGGTGTTPAETDKEEGAKFTLALATGIANGDKTFAGWNDGRITYAAGAEYTMPKANVTLTAQWTDGVTPPADVEYTVTYDLNGGTGTTPTETDKEEGEKFILALATGITNGDKTFAGWNDGTKTYAAGAEYTMPKANVTLTAQWTGGTTPDNPDDPDDPDAPPEITEEINGFITHDSEKTAGTIYLYDSGEGYIEIVNKKSELALIQCYITYSITDKGVFTILTAPNSNLDVPATGKIAGRTVSITVKNTLNGNATEYAFEDKVSRVEVTSNVSVEKNVMYYPVGYPIDLTNVDSQKDYELTGFKVNKTEDKTLDWGQNFVVPANNIAIKYIWSKIETVNYTVTYKAGDGVGEDYVDTAVHADYTLKYNTVTNFTRTGYKFAGWTIGGVEYGTGAKVKLTGDTVVIARWNKVYTVSYANVGGSGINTNFDPEDTYFTEFTADRYFLPYGARPSMGSGTYFSRTGFTLRGWTSSSETTGAVHAPGEKYTLTEDTVFTAVWQSNATFDAYAGEYTSATGIVVDGTYDIKSVTMSGNKLKLNDDGTELEVELSMSDIAGTATGTLGFYSVTAVFDTNKVTITLKRLSTEYTAEFVKGGAATDKTLADYQGAWTGNISFNSCDYYMAVINGTNISFFEEGYEDYPDSFDLTPDTSDTNLIATFTVSNRQATITFTADNKFTLVVSTFTGIKTADFTKAQAYTVSFDLGADYAGTSTAPATQNVLSGGKASAPQAPVWQGHRFLGWYTDGATTAYNFDAAVVANVVLTARWEVLTEVTVTFNAMASDVTAPAAQTVAYNTAATEPQALVRTGYRFDGWYTEASMRNAYDFSSPVTSDITLYAKWSKAVTLTYAKSSAAQGELPASLTVYAGDKYTFAVCQLTCEGMTFLGWKVNSDAANLYRDGATYTVNSFDITLTAVFGKTYSNNVDGDIKLIVRDDNKVVYYDEILDFDKEGDILTITEYGVNIRLDGNTWIQLDVMYTMEFAAKDGTKLTFNGEGTATLGTHSASYTLKIEDYSIVGFSLVISDQTYAIDFENDGNDNIVINVEIKVGSDTYVFGNPPVVNAYTVTYEVVIDGEEIVGTAPASTTVNSDVEGKAVVTLDAGDTFVRLGYTFSGWKVKGGDDTVYTTTYTTSSDVTFVPVWTEDKTDPDPTVLKLKDFAGETVIYGYASVEEAGANSFKLSTYTIYALYFRWNANSKSFQVFLYSDKGTRGAYTMKDPSTNSNITDGEINNCMVCFSTSGVTTRLAFSLNSDGEKVVTINDTLTWSLKA